MRAIVNYSSATEQYSLIIVGSGNPSSIWSKWYQGPTEPVVLDPNPCAGTAAGVTHWHTQHPNSGSQVFGPQTVTPSPGHGVKLVVWELPNDGSTFAMDSAWEPPHAAASGSASQLPANSVANASPGGSECPPSHSNCDANTPPPGRPSKKRRDDDVVPVDLSIA